MDELIERLRSVKWEVTGNGELMPNDPAFKCVFVDMRPDEFEALLTEAAAALEAAREDAERWRFVRRKLCLTGNGNGTCGMQALNLPAAIPGWPEPGKVAEFCDAAIDHAIWKENGDE